MSIDQPGHHCAGRESKARLVGVSVALDLFAWSDTGDRAIAYEDGTIGDRLPVRSGENVGGGDQHVTRFSL
ncbi:hypothetical protein ABZT45_22490 [Streptomyces sp. NPDC005356]|uniref:hypothetical protein n=1 Tax=Streptomyces sp. NPDC005356 TaxID=3157167 RepID=UPI0033BDBC3F